MIRKIWKNEFGRGAIILFLSANFFNFLNLVFNFFTGRMLGPEKYGILATLMAFVSIYSIPSEVIQNLMSKYTTKLKGNSFIKYVFSRVFKKSFLLASVLFFILSLISFPLSSRLGINVWLLILTNLFIFISFLSPIPRGVLQGKKDFSHLGVQNILEGILKLGLAILFIYLGFEVSGAFGAVLISGIFATLLSFYFCKKVILSRPKRSDVEGIKIGQYFVFVWSILLFFSLDIILAKYFLSSDLAGKYASLSLLGKIIYLGTSSISKVMFPLVSERNENKKGSNDLFLKSIFSVLLFGIIGVLFYSLFSEKIVLLLYGKEYLEISNYLVISGFSFLILSLTNLNLMYLLSSNRTKNYLLVILGVFAEIIIFSLCDKTLFGFSLALLFSNIAMFILTIFLFKE